LSFAAQPVKVRLAAAKNTVRYDRAAGTVPGSCAPKLIAGKATFPACNHLICHGLEVINPLLSLFDKPFGSPGIRGAAGTRKWSVFGCYR
jgi:hypothetical protein